MQDKGRRREDPQLRLDLEAGRAAGETGQGDALEADRVQAWRDVAEAALEELRGAGRPFTADDVVDRVGLPDAGTNRNNAVGALLGAAARRGEIRRVGRRPTARVIGHARTISVWLGVPDAGDGSG